jgi:hypothetical protein
MISAPLISQELRGDSISARFIESPCGDRSEEAYPGEFL